MPTDEELQFLADMRTATREAHEAAQALRDSVREAHAETDRYIKERWVAIVDESLQRELDTHVPKVKHELDRVCNKAVAEFDKLVNILRTGKASGKGQDVQDLVAAALRSPAGIRPTPNTPDATGAGGFRMTVKESAMKRAQRIGVDARPTADAPPKPDTTPKLPS